MNKHTKQLLARANKLIRAAEQRIRESRADNEPHPSIATTRCFYNNAWGLFNLAGNYAGMAYCREKLEETGLGWNELAEQQRLGYITARIDAWRIGMKNE